jgi:hypothetical protein
MIKDYLVRWSAANHHNVATQLTHYKTDSFAIQNQASHVTFNSLSPEGRAAGAPNPPLVSQGATLMRLGIPTECVPESGLVDEHIQSDWRTIA